MNRFAWTIALAVAGCAGGRFAFDLAGTQP